MSQIANLVKHRWVNGWPLFGLVVIPLSVAVLLQAARLDLANPRSISSLIQLSVRLAVPWLFLAFAASSLAAVYPSILSRWLLRNRRIIGLCFAAGMAWQLLFICWLAFGHWGYYVTEEYNLRDLAEQLPGYLVLAAMTVTSFKAGRTKLTAAQWRWLHKGGIYFLWFVVWTTYWFELFYYSDVQIIDTVYYWIGAAAWGFRVIAWSKKQRNIAGAERYDDRRDAHLQLRLPHGIARIKAQ